jgi:hypothetical protein
MGMSLTTACHTAILDRRRTAPGFLWHGSCHPGRCIKGPAHLLLEVLFVLLRGGHLGPGK